jgi:hypothetical protein
VPDLRHDYGLCSPGAQRSDDRLPTPPYSWAGAKVEGDKLIYPIPRIDDPDDFRANPLVLGRHVMSVVDDLWAAVERFVDQLLAVFYPRPSSDQSV